MRNILLSGKIKKQKSIFVIFMALFSLENLIVSFGLICLAFLSRRKIEYGIYLIVFFLPFYLVKINVFGIPSTVLELGIYILFLVWLIKNYKAFSAAGVKKQLSDFQKSEKILSFGVLLLLSGAIVSTVFSPDIRASAGILKGWFLDPFLVFIVLVAEIKTFEQKKNILKALFLSGLAAAIASLAYLFIPELGGVSYDGRLHAFYLSPNHLAMYLAPALIIGLWFAISVEKRFLCVISGILIAAAIYFTYSYAAWFAVFISIGLFIFLLAKKTPGFRWKHEFRENEKRGLLILAVFALIFLAAFLGQLGTDKFNNLKNLAYRSSFNSRIMIWRSAFEIGKDNFIIGIGPGNFQRFYLDYQSRFSEPYLEWAVPEPHNVFLAFWLETGLLGLIGFVLILSKFFDASIIKKASIEERGLTLVLLAIMTYTAVHGFFDTTYWKNDLSVIFWLVLGMTVIGKKSLNPPVS